MEGPLENSLEQKGEEMKKKLKENIEQKKFDDLEELYYMNAKWDFVVHTSSVQYKHSGRKFSYNCVNA